MEKGATGSRPYQGVMSRSWGKSSNARRAFQHFPRFNLTTATLAMEVGEVMEDPCSKEFVARFVILFTLDFGGHV